jgi:hypothetical protein
MKCQTRISSQATVPCGLDCFRRCSFWTRLLVFFCLAAVVPRVFAAEPVRSQLTGKIDLRFQRCRSGAPIPVVWEIEWNEQAVAQGALDFEIEDGNELLGSFHLSDVVLSPGKNVFNSMLPAMSVFSRSAPVTLRVRFVSGKQSYEFEEQSLRVPNRFTQWFNVAVVSGVSGKPSQSDQKMLEAIRWERLLPVSDPSDRSTTVSLDLQTPALPVEPLTFCNFDAVVLLPAALSEIRDDQAEALRKWVTAGGSLCLIAGGGLTPRHSRLLSELLSEATGQEAFVVDSHGYLAPGEEFTGEIVSAHKGLGRVVVLRQALFEKLKPDAKEWISAAKFLMKARREPSMLNIESAPARAQRGQGSRRSSSGSSANRAAVKGARPNPSKASAGPPPKQAAAAPAFVPNTIKLIPVLPPGAAKRAVPPLWQMPYDLSSMVRPDLSPPPMASMSALFQLLMPRDVQMVPLSLIGAVLAAYIVVIGPVDYFVLGLLRMRRLTWILFPVVTIAFAVFTLFLSRWYLGTNDSRQAIEINDIVKGGTTARRTRIELLFLSRAREVGTDVQNGAFSHVALGIAADPRLLAMTRSGEVGRVDQTLYAGRIPGHYVVGQSVPQWTPTVNRYFWIDPKPTKSEKAPAAVTVAPFDWDHSGDLTSRAECDALAARIRQAFGENACAVVFRGGRADVIPVLNSLQSLRKPRTGSYEPLGEMQIGEIVREMSCRKPEKLFALTSQIAPNGSPNLDDLAVLDGSDPGQSLLVIGVPSGPDLILYRRLYAGGP